MSDLITVIDVFVASIISYGHMLYLWLYLKRTRKLQLVHNFAQFAGGGGGGFKQACLYTCLPWFPVSFWVQFKMLIWIGQSLSGYSLDSLLPNT